MITNYFDVGGSVILAHVYNQKLNNKLLPHLRVFKKLVHRWRKTTFANPVTLYLMHVICYKNTTVRLEIAQVMNLNL